jgi:hypothetical protein
MRKRFTIALAAMVAALALAGVAGAALVPQGSAENAVVTDTAGNFDTAAVQLTVPAGPTTRIVVGGWSSATIAAPLHFSYVVSCGHPGNSTAGAFSVVAGRNVNGAGDGIVIFTASPLIAAPWYGWDTCSATINVSQDGDGTEDHSIAAWVANHN